MTNETETTTTPPAPTDAWRAALSSRRTDVANPGIVPAAAVTGINADVSRRTFIRTSFWSGLGISLLGSVGTLLDFLYPRNVKGFGGPVPAGNLKELAKGADPKMFSEGQFWLTNLDPKETRLGGTGGGEGLIALWRKCPHLGCTVPWRSAFEYNGDKGWFRCPCHGSTYTKAGVRVYGPAPRSMDTMKIEIDKDGNVVVQTGSITPGGPDNPTRAIKV